MAIEDSGAGPDALALFASSLGVTYPLYYDATKAARETYGLRVTSTTFILSSDFVVRDKAEYGTTTKFLETSWKAHGQAK